MDPDQKLLDDHHAREDALRAAQWALKKADVVRYEDAAKEAHKFRLAAFLVCNCAVLYWDELDFSSRQHLIADAEAVAKTPSITEPELRKLYRERLLAWGDTDNPDLQPTDELNAIIEASVLEHLKLLLCSDASE